MAELHVDELGAQLRATADRWTVLRRVAYPALAFAGGFIVAGFSETSTVVAILILLPLALWYRHPLLWCALAGMVAGFGVVSMSPGNAIRNEALRADGFTGRLLPDALREAFYQTALFIGQTLVYRFYAVAPVMIVAYMVGQGQRVKARSARILATFLGGYALIVASILPVLLLAGYPSYRSFTIPTFILIASCGGIGYLLACRE